jgi:DNA polymerase-1
MARTTGPSNASVALVSRSPGFYEAKAGKPFSGPSGKVLDYLLAENGVKREQILVTNTVLCSPKEGKVPPQAIKCCSPRLHSELRSARTVIAAGSEAVGEILHKTGINSLRGYDHQLDGKRIIVTNNPAIVLRNDATFPNLVKDFKLAFNPRPKPVLPNIEVIHDPTEAVAYLQSLRSNIKRLQNRAIIAADIETRGGLSHKAKLLSFNVSTDGRTATVLGEAACNNAEVIAELRTLLETRAIEFIWHNGKYDVKVLRTQHDIDAQVDQDTLLLGYACDERPGVHSLEYMLMDEFAWPNYSSEDIESFKSKGGIGPVPEGFYDYAGLDAAGTFQLFNVTRTRAIKDQVYDSPYKRLLIRGSEALTRLELTGIRYNYQKAAELYEDEIEPTMNEQIASMREQIDNPLFNPRSNPQLHDLYYDKWKIQHPAQRRPNKEFSVDVAARETILEGNFTTAEDRKKIGRASDDSIAEHRLYISNFTQELDDYKSLQKQASTYIISLISAAEKDKDGKVFTELNLAGTESGRLSSKGPNLQNITRTKEGLPNIRGLFEATPGRRIVSADYSQAELRTIAHLSGDTELNAIYYDTDRSIHKEMAAQFYGENYTYEEYVKAKNIDFGVFYLQGAFSFATMYHMPQKEAQEFINEIWKRFPTVKDWTESVKEDIRSNGTLVNPFGRKRRFYLLTDENREHSFKEGINFRAQSTASDITLSALILLVDLVDWNRCGICLTVHDSIIADVDTDYIPEYCEITKEVMETRPKEELDWDIPFVADFSVGRTWGTLEELNV